MNVVRREWQGFFSEESDSAWVAQLVERVLGKDEVTGSIPVPGSRSSAVLEVSRGLSGGNSTVESHSSKVMVAGSNPVPRSKGFKLCGAPAHCRARKMVGAAAAEWRAQMAKKHGEGEIRAQQAAREHWDDRAHRSWQDDFDGRDHQGALEAQSQGAVPRV